MTRIATTATEQYLALIDYYLERERPEAAERLTEAVEQAAKQTFNPRLDLAVSGMADFRQTNEKAAPPSTNHFGKPRPAIAA